MKKSFVYGILCVIALSICVCAGCSKEANSGEAEADNPNAAGTDNSNEGMAEGSGISEGIHLEFDPDTKTMLTWMAPYGVANSDDDVCE